MSDTTGLGDGSSILKSVAEEFDQAFANPPELAAPAADGYLAFRLAGEPFAVSQRELAGVLSDCRVVSVAGRAGLLGIAGVRGRVVAVFDLAQLVMNSPTPFSDRQWLIWSAAQRDAAFCAERFEDYIVLGARGVKLERAGSKAPTGVTQTLCAPDEPPRWVIELQLVLNGLSLQQGTDGGTGGVP